MGSAQVSLRRDRAFSSPLILSLVGGDAEDTGWSVYTGTKENTLLFAVLLLDKKFPAESIDSAA